MNAKSAGQQPAPLDNTQQVAANDTPFVIGPCRYGLTIEEAKRHANDLVLTWGWSAQEVVEVLGVEPTAA